MADAVQQPEPTEQPPQFNPAEFWPKYIEEVQTLEKQVKGMETRAKSGIVPDLKNDFLPVLKDAVELLGMQQLMAVEYVIIPGTIQQMLPGMLPAMLEQILPDMIPDVLDAINPEDRLTPETATLLRDVIMQLMDRAGITDVGTSDPELVAKSQEALEAIKDAEMLDDEEPEEEEDDAGAEAGGANGRSSD